jgi:hypothetical protein
LKLAKWLWGLRINRVDFAEGQSPGDADGGEVYSFDNGHYSLTYYNGGADGCYIVCGNGWYKIEQPSEPPIDTDDKASPGDRRPMVMVNGAIYLDTGRSIAAKIDESAIAGRILTSVGSSEIPTENNTSNFDAGGASFAYYEDGLVLLLNDQWIFFEKDTSPQIPKNEPLTPQDQITAYLTDMMTAAYSPYYEGLRFAMSNYAETLDGKTITATFYWTMYHLNNGLDISYEIGLEEQGNFSLQVAAQLDESGHIVPSTIKILSDTAANGPAE